MKYFVNLTYPVCTDDTGALIDRIDEGGRAYTSAVWDAQAGTTALTTVVLADNPIEAITVAMAQVGQITALIGARPDAVEALSERAQIEKLGGYEMLQKVRERFKVP